MPELTDTFERWAIWINRDKLGDKSGYYPDERSMGRPPKLFPDSGNAKTAALALGDMCIAGYEYKVVRVRVTIEEIERRNSDIAELPQGE